MFKGNDEWLFCGADYNALEDVINALLTKDPNKLKVLIGEQMYKVSINGETHRISELDVVSYDGKQITGKELYELLN